MRVGTLLNTRRDIAVRLLLNGLNTPVICAFKCDHHYWKTFLIARPAVIAGSLLMNERFICPSTRNEKRSFMDRSGLVNAGRTSISISTAGVIW